MSTETYQSAVLSAKLCADLLRHHDIPEILGAIERAETLGPVLDPTLYRQKIRVMEEDRELLRAAQVLRKFGREG
jgi:hypothetical protein